MTAYADSLTHRSSEEIATSIMEKVVQGDTSTLKRFLKHEVQPGLLHHVLSKLKSEGNNAVKQGKYDQAIELYNQALAGTKQKKSKAILFSNLSYAYLQRNDLQLALETARQAIAFNPGWSKGWYRAAQVFEKKKEYNSALTIIKAALKRSPEYEVIRKLYQRVIPLAQKEKALERLSIDYSRFQFIDEGEPGLTSEEAHTETLIEYSDQLTEQQKQQLDQILNPGASDSTDTFSKEDMPTILRFNSKSGHNQLVLPRSYKQHLPKEKVSSVKIRHGLVQLLRVRSELLWPRRVVLQQLLYAPKVLEIYLTEIINKSQALERLHQNDPIFWLFLGVGTCVPLVGTALLDSKKHFITACTHHTYPFPLWMAERMLELHNLRKRDHLRILNKRILQLTFLSSTCDTLDTELCDIPFKKPSVLILDQECFDSVGISNGIIHHLRDFRCRLCPPETSESERTESLLTIPASMTLVVYGACLNPSPKTFERYFWEKSNTSPQHLFETSCKERYKIMMQGRWSPIWEPIAHTSYSGLESNDANQPIILLTEPVAIQRFTFNGSYETLEQDLPLNVPKTNQKFLVTQSGMMNCILIRTKFHFSLQDNRVEQWRESNEAKAWGAAAPAVMWISPRYVKEGTLQTFDYTLSNGSDILVSVPECEEELENDIKSITIPRWQYDALSDVETLKKFNSVLEETVASCLVQKCSRLDARPYLTSMKHQGLEILLLNSCLGSTAVAGLKSAAHFFSLRGSRPHPSVHVTCIEPSPAHVVVAKAFLAYHHKHMDETVLMKEHAKKNPSIEWIHFSKTTAREDNFNNQQEFQKESDTPSTDNSLKLKTRYSVVARNLCCLRPPGHSLSSKTQLAVKRFLNRPLDVPLPSTLPVYELQDKVDIVVCQMMDCSLVGEGLIATLSFAHEALCKPTPKIIPSAARVYMAAVHLGPAAFEINFSPKNTISNKIRPSCWSRHLLGDCRGALGLVKEENECIPLNLDTVEHVWMTEPILIFEFNMAQPPQWNDPLQQWNHQVKNFNLTALQDGVINAVVFWYEVDLEPKPLGSLQSTTFLPRGYSTRPHSIKSCEQSQPRSSRAIQACYLLSEALEFNQNESVPLVAWHTASNIGARWDEKQLPDFTLRLRSRFQVLKKNDPLAPYWQSCAEQYVKNIDQLAAILTDVRENASMIRSIADEVFTILKSGFEASTDTYIEREELGIYLRDALNASII